MGPLARNLLLACVVAGLVWPADRARAQSDNAIIELLQDFERRKQRNANPGPRIIQLDPQPQQQRQRNKRQAQRRDAATAGRAFAVLPFDNPPVAIAAVRSPPPAEQASTPLAVVAPVPVEHHVTILGDSLGQLLANGLTAQFVPRPDIAVTDEAKGSSGFVRDDFFDWNDRIDELLASGQPIDAVVIMIGSNDRQPLTDANGTHEFRSPEWLALYQARIDRALRALTDRNVAVYWVGLPPMRAERMNADAVAFNALYKDRVGKVGGTYVDIWDAFADDAGGFAAIGPDLTGQPAKLRTGDGVHLTKAGAQLAAHFVERALLRRFGAAPSLASLIERSAPGPVAAPPRPVVPFERQPAAGTALVEERPRKPEAGPILPLTGYGQSPGGVLLGAPAAGIALAGPPIPVPSAPGATVDPSVAIVLDEGKALEPKPGRVDGFPWPPPGEGPDQVATR